MEKNLPYLEYQQQLQQYYTNFEPHACIGYHQKSGAVIFCTEKYAKLCGVSATELIDKRIRDLDTPQADLMAKSLSFYFDTLSKKHVNYFTGLLSIPLENPQYMTQIKKAD